MRKLAVIPARSGSKRIVGKNKRDFLGKPIILYAVEAAIKSGLFDEVMVYTDDDDIVTIISGTGAHVPFKRNPKNADDQATLSDVMLEVLTHYAEDAGFDYVCMILPTAALLKPQALKNAYEVLVEKDYSSVIPVVRFSYPIQRALHINDQYKLTFFDKKYQFTRSQDLQPAYHDAAQFYWIRVTDFMNEQTIFMQNTGALELNEDEVQDIDTVSDWKLAELKYRVLNKSDEA